MLIFLSRKVPSKLCKNKLFRSLLESSRSFSSEARPADCETGQWSGRAPGPPLGRVEPSFHQQHKYTLSLHGQLIHVFDFSLWLSAYTYVLVIFCSTCSVLQLCKDVKAQIVFVEVTNSKLLSIWLEYDVHQRWSVMVIDGHWWLSLVIDGHR